jgi:hypothetical protein
MEQDTKWGSLKVKRTSSPEEHRGAPSVRVCDHLLEEMDMARGPLRIIGDLRKEHKNRWVTQSKVGTAGETNHKRTAAYAARF